MTVAELIKELEEMPQDAIVRLDGGRWYLADAVIYDEHYECVIIMD